MKNQIHALLGAHGFTSPLADLFGKAERSAIEKVKDLLPLDVQVELISCMGRIEWQAKELRELDEHLAARAISDHYANLLMTIRGVNVVTALSISAYIVDISRFPTGKKLAAYAGIVPIVSNSEGRKYCGPITKAGPPTLRWALTEVAQSTESPEIARLHMIYEIRQKAAEKRNVKKKVS